MQRDLHTDTHRPQSSQAAQSLTKPGRENTPLGQISWQAVHRSRWGRMFQQSFLSSVGCVVLISALTARLVKMPIVSFLFYGGRRLGPGRIFQQKLLCLAR